MPEHQTVPHGSRSGGTLQAFESEFGPCLTTDALGFHLQVRVQVRGKTESLARSIPSSCIRQGQGFQPCLGELASEGLEPLNFSLAVLGSSVPPLQGPLVEVLGQFRLKVLHSNLLKCFPKSQEARLSDFFLRLREWLGRFA